jgi:hypothetical protein
MLKKLLFLKLPLHFEKKEGTMFFPPLLLANIEEKVIFLAWKQNEILSIYPRVLVKGLFHNGIFQVTFHFFF